MYIRYINIIIIDYIVIPKRDDCGRAVNTNKS